MRYMWAPVDPAAEFFHLAVLHMPQASCEHFAKRNLKFTWAFTQREANLTTCLFMQDALNTLMWWFDNSRRSLSARVRYLGGARTCPTSDNVCLGEHPIKTQQLPTTPRGFSFLKEGREGEREEDSSVCDGWRGHNKKWEGMVSSACCCLLISFIKFKTKAALRIPLLHNSIYNFPYIFPVHWGKKWIKYSSEGMLSNS